MPDADRNPPTTPLRAWRHAGGWVVWRGPAAQPIVSSIPRRRASGRPLAEPPADFWLLGANGDVTRRFESIAWSIDDELGASLFTVEDGSLLEITVQDRFRGEVSIREKVAVAGLMRVAEDDIAEVSHVSAAIRREEAVMEKRRRDAEQAGLDRLAAVPGALESFDAGDGFEHAHGALSAQISRYHAPTSEAMLRRLTAFGALHRGASGSWRDTLGWAMEPFVTACRIVAFDLFVRRVEWSGDAVEPSPVPPGQQGDVRALADSLRELRAEVKQAAEWADDSDARNTAIGLWQAADGIEEARARLERAIGDAPARATDERTPD
jgi:hypothetical protein